MIKSKETKTKRVENHNNNNNKFMPKNVNGWYDKEIGKKNYFNCKGVVESNPVSPSIHPFVGYHHCLDDGNSGIKSVNKNITLLTQL